MIIDKQTPLQKALELGSDCDQCGRCCLNSTGFLVQDDNARIAKHLGISEEELEKNYLERFTKFGTTRLKPKLIKKKVDSEIVKACIFLDGKLCSIHKVKPLQCRVCNTKKHSEQLSDWFDLNYFVDPDNPVSIREWALRLEIKPTIPGGKLHELIQDPKKLKDILEYKDYEYKEKKIL